MSINLHEIRGYAYQSSILLTFQPPGYRLPTLQILSLIVMMLISAMLQNSFLLVIRINIHLLVFQEVLEQPTSAFFMQVGQGV